MIRPPPAQQNMMRLLRRRLGLSQKELAFVLGYDTDSQVSRIENGSRTPHLTEVLVIELVFGIPAMTVFPEIRQAIGRRIRRRLKLLLVDTTAAGPNPRVSYKVAQLQRVLASLRSRNSGLSRSYQ
jgi:transcriptional regulator with XRE-family HTH domain